MKAPFIRLANVHLHYAATAFKERSLLAWLGRSLRLRDNSGKVDDNDYVFMPKYGEKQRDYALQLLQLQFEILMWDTGLGVDTQGNNRTLYSLRHTAIMYRLLFGESINTLLLARNARTSVEMIDRFYAKPLSGEMNIEMLQSKRRRRKYYDGEQAEK